jgi:cytosine/adenosine deaminase-related metal-dependent hydrolase
LVTGWSTQQPAIENGALYIDAEVVQEVGPFEEVRSRHPAAEMVGDGSHLVIPGFVNAHSHGRGITTLRQRIPDDPGEVRSVGLRIGLSGDPYWDVLYTCARQLEAGITATMHLDTNYGYGPWQSYEERLRKLITAYGDSGIRFSVALPFRDPDIEDAYLSEEFLSGLTKEVRSEVQEWRKPSTDLETYFSLYSRLGREFPKASLQFEPVSHGASSGEYLMAIRKEAASNGRRIQLHLLETAYQKAYSLKRFGKTNVERLAEIGFLGPDVSCAHCVWFTEHDIGIVRDAGAKVVHLPSANLRLRSGLAPIKPMADAGISIALGTDNLALNDDEDILQEVRLAQLLQSPPGIGESPIRPEAALRWVTQAGAQVLGIKDLGSLEPGSPADLVLFHVRSIERSLFEHGHDTAASLIQWARQSDIDQVLVGGQILVRDGRYIFRDREELERKAYERQRQWMLTPAIRSVRSKIGERYASQDFGGAPYYRLHSRMA